MKQSFLALAATYFASYPTENEIHFTKDEQAFFAKNDAVNHGKSLREKESEEVEVTTITRMDVEGGTLPDAPEKSEAGAAKRQVKK